MAKVRRFEELVCWQKARQLANVVHGLTSHPNFARDYKLRGQIQSAAGSAMHNIAEGGDAGTEAEFVRFLKIARRSCSEVQSQLYLALDLKYITEAELKPAYHLDDEVKRLINGLIAYLQNDNQAGHSTKQTRELPASYPTTDHSSDDNETSDH